MGNSTRELPAASFAARFARRAAKSIAFRTRNLVSMRALRLKLARRLFFPVRNAVLRHKPLTVKVDGESFLLAPAGAVPLEMWSGRYFERHEIEFLVGLLRPGMTFFDIGANVGVFSLPAAKKLQNGRVFAFEPAAWTFQRLLENVRLNDLSNLQVMNVAVGDYSGEAILKINAKGKDGLNTLGRPTHEDSEIVATETVPITTLDDFVRQNSISHIDVMKIDTEGAELFVLRGAANLLAKPDAPLILYEGGFLTKGFGYHPVETMWLLERHGYSCFVIDSKTGRISIPPAKRAYDATVIAAKPAHPAYPILSEQTR
jgi:FkbM family methyltransferase